jgi:hypothetical protein
MHAHSSHGFQHTPSPGTSHQTASGQFRPSALLNGVFDKLRILKKMTVTPMPAIETDRISGEKTPHDNGYRHTGCSQQQVKVIRHQRPGKTG